jgi:hypothetical protein
VVQSYSYDPSQRLGSIASNLTGTAQDVTTSFTYNPASQLDSVSKNSDAYAWTGHHNKDVVSAANGLNQLTSATPPALARPAFQRLYMTARAIWSPTAPVPTPIAVRTCC